MKKLLTLSFLISIASCAFAQGGSTLPSDAPRLSEKDKGKIFGAVVDTQNNQPVEFATVALMKTGTETPLDGTVCDDKGQFTISKISNGSYKVVVSFIGYETQTINDIVISDTNQEVSLGLIKLENSAKILNEVVVEGQKAIIEERVDRTIYNAENDQTARGGDATDVLKRVPMLSVDLDGNVSMRGSSNVRVLINNKPSTIMASSIADALKQIPADQIKSVEVITSPSAKYDAEGSAGIINIVTKKNTLEGLTLSLDAGVGLRGSNLGLNGNYRKKKMGFSIGGWGRANYNVNGRYENDQSTRNSLDDPFTTTHQEAETRNQGLFGNYTLGWDYDINDKNFITASARFGARNGKNYQDDLYTSINNDPDSSSLRDTETENISNSVDVSLTFTHLYDKPQRELSFMGSYSRNNRDNNFVNLIREQDEVSDPSGFKNLNESYDQEMTIQVDYQTPIGANQMLEFGGKDIARKVFSEYTYFGDEDGDGVYEPSGNSTLSNNLNYDQNVLAGYLSYTYSSPSGYSIKAGSRYEYTTIDAYTETEDDIDIPSYGAMVPSINISKKLENGKTIKAAYNRRIQRPSIRYLNPNVQASNPYDISYGNPNLDPEYSNNYELSYSTFIKGTSLNFSAFWRNTNNAIQDVRDVVTIDTIQRVETTYKNIGQEDALGMNIFANVNIGKLTLNGGTDFYYSILDNNIPVDPLDNPYGQYSAHNEGWVISYRLFGNYSLSKGWGFQFFGFYRGRQVQLQGEQGGFGIYSLGLKKDFNNKKGSIGFGAENFFSPEFKIRNELNSPLVNREGINTMRNMSFRINFSYRIGKMSMDAKPKRKRSINNDDLKDGGGGDGMDSGNINGGNAGGGNNAQRGGGGFTMGNQQRTNTTTKPGVTTPVDTAAVVNAEGSWNYTIDSPQGGEGTLVLKKESDKYTGTISNKRFNSESPLSSVTLNGNELTFSYDVTFGANTTTIIVKAIISGDTLSGNMALGQFGTFPINAKKVQ